MLRSKLAVTAPERLQNAFLPAEGVMIRTFDSNQRHRARLLNRARELARTGRHPDHTSILAQLQTIEGFAEAAEAIEPIRFQLDRLCAMSRAGT